MVDAMIPAADDAERFAERYLLETLPTLERTPPPDLANAESLKPMVLPMIQRATMGRPNPRAPYVALDVMVQRRGAAAARGEQARARRVRRGRHLVRRQGRHALLLHPAVGAEAAEEFSRQAAAAEEDRRRRHRRLHGQRHRLAGARSRLPGGRPRAAAAVRRRRPRQAARQVRPRGEEGHADARRTSIARSAASRSPARSAISSTATWSSKRAWRIARSRRSSTARSAPA